jgi:iron complex outermembrane receptor protein
MINNKNYLYSTLALSLVLFNTNVIAQDESDQNVEEVVVTGSKIKKDEFASSSPLDIVTAEEILESGAASIDEYLKFSPAFTGYQLGTTTNNGGNGSRELSLRGLGATATLVLINGRRTIGDVSGSGAVDVGMIPENLVKNVDVLLDGASTVYGSDAIAGVVNFVLDKEFEGLKFNASRGEGMEDGQAANYDFGFVAGLQGEKGGVVFATNVESQKEMKQAEQPWAYDALYPQLQSDGTFKAVGSGSSNSRKITSDASKCVDPTESTAGCPVSGNNPAYLNGSWIYDSAAGKARKFASSDVYNYAPVNALVTPNERKQFAVLGEFEVAEGVTFFFDAIYNKRDSMQRLAPDASFTVSSSVETPNNGIKYNTFVPANNPYNPFGSVACANDAGLCDIDVRINRRFEESGGRLFVQSMDQYTVTQGLDFSVGDIDMQVFMTWGETNEVDETRNYGRFDRWAIAVDPVACAANASCPGVLNPFGDFGSITAEQMAFLSTNSLKDQSTNDLEIYGFNASGSMNESTQYYVGYEKRSESGEYKPDEFLSEGLTTGGAGGPLSGGFSVQEIFGEIYSQVSEDLSVDASVRHSDYDTVGSSTTYKVGADYVLSDTLRLRGTYGTGFRAPTVGELNTTTSTTFPVVDLPCEFGQRRLDAGEISQATYDGCIAAGFDVSDDGEYGFAWQSYVEYSATGDLKPEESTNMNLGLVYQNGPWSLSADYWSIEIENLIGYPDINVLIRQCLGSGSTLNSPSCNLFDPLGYGIYPGDAYLEYGNLGDTESSGWDFNVGYAQDISLGMFTELAVDWNAMLHDEYVSGFGGAAADRVGTAKDGGVYPEMRYWLTTTISSNNLSLSWNVRHLDETIDLFRTPSSSADVVAEAITYHDITGVWNTNDQLTVRFGINNITEENPPYFHSNFNANTEPGVWDVIGRRMFVGLQYQF